jgi:hypothetical protein
MKRTLAAIAVILLGTVQAQAAESVFDPPLDTKTQVFPEAKDTPKTTLTCRYYPHFMVKQIDEGDIGADQLSIVPSSGGAKPPCQRDNLPAEKVVNPDDWTGYFKGVKGDFVFFDAEDGVNGGLGFAVFTPDARKLFDDSAAGELESAALNGETLTLRYTRSFAGACSEPKEGAGCWAQIAAAAGIDKAAKPDCAAGYAKLERANAGSYCEQEGDKSAQCVANHLKEFEAQHWDESPSVVAYRVETVLGPGKPAVKALSGALSCSPAD